MTSMLSEIEIHSKPHTSAYLLLFRLSTGAEGSWECCGRTLLQVRLVFDRPLLDAHKLGLNLCRQGPGAPEVAEVACESPVSCPLQDHIARAFHNAPFHNEHPTRSPFPPSIDKAF